MKTALVYGSTGLIGSALLPILLASEEYRLVKALTRKPLPLKHEKLETLIYNFDNPDAEKIEADQVFCCMGTTMRKAGSPKAFYRVDHDYVVETATLAYQKGAKLFSLVSAIGANANSRIYYNRVKGEVEDSIREIGFEGLHIFQPSLLLGKRDEFRLLEGLSQAIMRNIGGLVPLKSRGVPAKKVAETMVQYAIDHADQQLVVTNAEILRFNSAKV